jgi:hypothetical protein
MLTIILANGVIGNFQIEMKRPPHPDPDESMQTHTTGQPLVVPSRHHNAQRKATN